MRDDGPGHDGQCVVHLFGVQVNTASFAMYTFSFAVLVQALVVVSFSSMADHGGCSFHSQT
jgi:UMF1 family MFS transporter